MEKEVAVAIVGSITTFAVAIGGWVFGWILSRDAKSREWQHNRLKKLEDEVRARFDVEKCANEWLAELTNKTPQAVMLEVRNRAEEKSGSRPQMSPSDLVSRD